MADALKSFLRTQEPSQPLLVPFHFLDLGLPEHGLVRVANLIGIKALELSEHARDVIGDPFHDQGEEESAELVQGGVCFILGVFEGLDTDAILRLESECVGVVVDDDDFSKVAVKL